jgi:hypothetical protein
VSPLRLSHGTSKLRILNHDIAGRKGDRYDNQMQRDNWYAAVTFEDWENGVRDHVDKLIARR